MAQIVLGVVGGVVGGFFGGPAGAMAGFSLGSMIGGLIDPPDGQHTDQVGPRLSDLKVQNGQYGVPINFVLGEMRMAGNVIWARDIHEVTTTTETSSGGKGGPSNSNTSTTYTYFGRFAVGICEGAALVEKIWANGKLIYDTTQTPVYDKYNCWAFYLGDETQLPDPFIESFEGAGNVPAYRGICYAVAQELPLADFGNGNPNLEFLVCANGAVVTPPLSCVLKPSSATILHDSFASGDFTELGIHTGELNATWQRGPNGTLSGPISTNSLQIIASKVSVAGVWDPAQRGYWTTSDAVRNTTVPNFRISAEVHIANPLSTVNDLSANAAIEMSTTQASSNGASIWIGIEAIKQSDGTMKLYVLNGMSGGPPSVELPMLGGSDFYKIITQSTTDGTNLKTCAYVQRSLDGQWFTPAHGWQVDPTEYETLLVTAPVTAGFYLPGANITVEGHPFDDLTRSALGIGKLVVERL